MSRKLVVSTQSQVMGVTVHSIKILTFIKLVMTFYKTCVYPLSFKVSDGFNSTIYICNQFFLHSFCFRGTLIVFRALIFEGDKSAFKNNRQLFLLKVQFQEVKYHNPFSYLTLRYKVDLMLNA